jgi:hypothetical protein
LVARRLRSALVARRLRSALVSRRLRSALVARRLRNASVARRLRSGAMRFYTRALGRLGVAYYVVNRLPNQVRKANLCTHGQDFRRDFAICAFFARQCACQGYGSVTARCWWVIGKDFERMPFDGMKAPFASLDGASVGVGLARSKLEASASPVFVEAFNCLGHEWGLLFLGFIGVAG